MVLELSAKDVKAIIGRAIPEDIANEIHFNVSWETLVFGRAFKELTPVEREKICKHFFDKYGDFYIARETR